MGTKTKTTQNQEQIYFAFLPLLFYCNFWNGGIEFGLSLEPRVKLNPNSECSPKAQGQFFDTFKPRECAFSKRNI